MNAAKGEMHEKSCTIGLIQAKDSRTAREGGIPLQKPCSTNALFRKTISNEQSYETYFLRLKNIKSDSLYALDMGGDPIERRRPRSPLRPLSF